MPKYTAIQVAAFAGRAGFPSAVIPVVVTIAYGESGFDSDRVGDVKLQDEKWGPSIGLMQVRSLRNPDAYQGADRLRVASKLSDPLYNMQAAKAIYDAAGGKFTDWSVYLDRNKSSSSWTADNARINKELNNSSLWQQVQAIGTVQQSQFWNTAPGQSFWSAPGTGGQSVTDAVGDSTTGLGQLTNQFAGLDAIGSLATKLQDGQWWRRVGIGAAGWGLILFGLLFLLVTSGGAKAVAGAAVSAVPGGGAVKTAVKAVRK